MLRIFLFFLFFEDFSLKRLPFELLVCQSFSFFKIDLFESQYSRDVGVAGGSFTHWASPSV